MITQAANISSQLLFGIDAGVSVFLALLLLHWPRMVKASSVCLRQPFCPIEERLPNIM